MRRMIGLLAAAAVVLTGRIAGAQLPPTPCDFVTGGGYIVTTANGIHDAAKANFAIAGSCMPGGDGHTLWGHLEYTDHDFTTATVNKLSVHWTDVTGYFFCGDTACTMFVDPPGKPTGTRLICGTARTNLPSPDATVNWAVKVTDNAEPGTNDTFMINVLGGMLDYTSGDQTLAGGNIQLHKPNNSGFFSSVPTPLNCAAFPVTPPAGCSSDTDCSTGQICTTAGVCEQCPFGTTPDPTMPGTCCIETFPGSGVCTD